MRRTVLTLVMMSLLVTPAHAGFTVSPTYTGRVNSAIGQNLKAALLKRGFLANDSRFNATIDAVSSVATTAALAASGVVAGSTWPVILAGLGISAVASYGVPWVMDKAVDWIWGSGTEAGKVQLAGTAFNTDITTLIAVPSDYKDPAFLTNAGDKFFYDSAIRTVRAFRTVKPTCTGSGCTLSFPYNQSSLNEDYSTAWDGLSTHRYWARRYQTYTTSGSGSTMLVSYTQLWELATPSGTKPISPPLAGGFLIPADLPARLPADTAPNHITAAMLADMINAMWRKAALSNPNVIPYPATDPVKEGEVAPWIAANPAIAPTGDDFFGPVAPAGSQSIPIADAAAPTSPTTEASSPATSFPCGGPNLPACAVTIDDSGFAGQDVDASGPSSWIGRMVDDFNDRVSDNQGDHGIDWHEWLPDLRFGAPRVACEPIELDFSSISTSWSLSLDICNNPLIQLIKQMEAWALYMFTAVYIWRRFRSSEIPAGAES